MQDASRYHRYIPLLSMPILRVDPTPFLAQFFLSSFLLTFGGPKLKAWWAPAETKLPSAAHTAKGTQECLWPVAHRCKIGACQPNLGVGAESEAAPDSPFTGHSAPAGRTAESIKLWKF